MTGTVQSYLWIGLIHDYEGESISFQKYRIWFRTERDPQMRSPSADAVEFLGSFPKWIWYS